MKYTDYIKTLTCCHCQSPNTEPHHIIAVGMGKMGGKSHDIHSMPLCRTCHSEVHLGPRAYPQTKWLCETQLKALKDGVLCVK